MRIDGIRDCRLGRRRRWGAMVLAAALALGTAACTGGDGTTDPTGPTVDPSVPPTAAPASTAVSSPTSAPSGGSTAAPTAAPTSVPQSTVEPPEVPAMPEPSSGPPGETAEQRAARLVAVVGDPEADPASVDAAWLEIYAAAGVPVLAELPRASADPLADDLFGPAWWTVWMLAGGRPDAGMALVDAIKPIVSDETTTASDADASTAVRAVLTDLDAARAAGDDHAAFLVAFLDARVRHAGVASLFETALDPVDTSVDLATAQLLQWVVVRGVVAVTVDAASAAEQLSGMRAPVALARRQAAARPCSEYWGSEQGTTITNTVISKVLGGVEIPGIKMPGIIEKIVDLNSAVIPKSAFERVTRSIAKINAATSLASLLMQLMSIEVGGAFDTLERTKTTSDGERITNRLDLSIDPGKLPDQNKQALCALSTLLNAAGISFTLPAAGPLVGIEVLLSGGTSFGDRVLFADQGQLKQDTDGTGSVTFDLLGKAQRKDLPDDVPQIDLEYGVVVEATGDPVNGNSIFNTFFDSLTALPAGALGFVAPAIDIARTVHWDLGEQFAPLVDWQTEFPYQMVGSQGDEQFDQLVCDITEPFTIQGSVFTMNFTPSGNGGTVDATGSTGGAQFEASGTYQLQMPNGLGRDGRLVANVVSTVRIPDREATVPLSIPFTLTALPPDAC